MCSNQYSIINHKIGNSSRKSWNNLRFSNREIVMINNVVLCSAFSWIEIDQTNGAIFACADKKIWREFWELNSPDILIMLMSSYERRDSLTFILSNIPNGTTSLVESETRPKLETYMTVTCCTNMGLVWVDRKIPNRCWDIGLWALELLNCFLCSHTKIPQLDKILRCGEEKCVGCKPCSMNSNGSNI